MVWVASSNAIHRREGSEWKVVDLGGVGGAKLFFEEIVFGAGGAANLVHSSGIVRWADGKATEVNLGGRPIGMRSAVAGPNGAIVAQAFKEIIVVGGDGAVKRYGAKDGSLKAQQIEAVAVDAGGRIWAATDLGVAVIAGGKATEWPQGSVDALTGSVKVLAVAAGGPALPEVGPVKTGKVTGKILRAGAAVAGATVEICKRPSSMFRKSPCNDAPWKAMVKTGADGVFSFDGVPLGTWRFAIEADGKWATGWDECCAGMKEGQAFDVGAITLKEMGK
jgi:hypothetical protein